MISLFFLEAVKASEPRRDRRRSAPSRIRSADSGLFLRCRGHAGSTGLWHDVGGDLGAGDTSLARQNLEPGIVFVTCSVSL